LSMSIMLSDTFSPPVNSSRRGSCEAIGPSAQTINASHSRQWGLTPFLPQWGLTPFLPRFSDIQAAGNTPTRIATRCEELAERYNQIFAGERDRCCFRFTCDNIGPDPKRDPVTGMTMLGLDFDLNKVFK